MLHHWSHEGWKKVVSKSQVLMERPFYFKLHLCNHAEVRMKSRLNLKPGQKGTKKLTGTT
jgi:hypothetical protein